MKNKIRQAIVDELIEDLEEMKEDYLNDNFYNSENYIPDGEEDFEMDDEYCQDIQNAIDILVELGDEYEPRN